MESCGQAVFIKALERACPCVLLRATQPLPQYLICKVRTFSPVFMASKACLRVQIRIGPKLRSGVFRDGLGRGG